MNFSRFLFPFYVHYFSKSFKDSLSFYPLIESIPFHHSTHITYYVMRVKQIIHQQQEVNERETEGSSQGSLKGEKAVQILEREWRKLNKIVKGTEKTEEIVQVTEVNMNGEGKYSEMRGKRKYLCLIQKLHYLMHQETKRMMMKVRMHFLLLRTLLLMLICILYYDWLIYCLS